LSPSLISVEGVSRNPVQRMPIYFIVLQNIENFRYKFIIFKKLECLQLVKEKWTHPPVVMNFFPTVNGNSTEGEEGGSTCTYH